jgi:hypothetical protein
VGEIMQRNLSCLGMSACTKARTLKRLFSNRKKMHALALLSTNVLALLSSLRSKHCEVDAT